MIGCLVTSTTWTLFYLLCFVVWVAFVVCFGCAGCDKLMREPAGCLDVRKTHKYSEHGNLVAQAQSWAGRLAWLGHLLDVQKVAGPNPVRPTTKSYFSSKTEAFSLLNSRGVWQ